MLGLIARDNIAADVPAAITERAAVSLRCVVSNKIAGEQSMTVKKTAAGSLSGVIFNDAVFNGGKASASVNAASAISSPVTYCETDKGACCEFVAVEFDNAFGIAAVNDSGSGAFGVIGVDRLEDDIRAFEFYILVISPRRDDYAASIGGGIHRRLDGWEIIGDTKNLRHRGGKEEIEGY